jgi:type II secretory pathway predicted ATPase ExeA
MFLEFYGLQEQPFGVTPDPRYLYMSGVHREALASLVYGIDAGLGFSTLIAEPGMGKTTLLNRVLSHFRSSARTAFIFETQCDSHELLRNLLLELEIGNAEENESNVALLNRLKHFLLDQARNHRRVLLVVDEAQNLDDSVLEAIRLLSNFETFRKKLLHIVLAGQPELASKLGRPEMAQLRQRINQANRLRPFKPEDSVQYIAHRLNVAGYSGPALFSPEALALLVSRSRGVPREINRLCFNALSLGCATQKRVIDDNIIKEVASDLEFGDEGSAIKAAETLDLSPFELAVQFSSAMSTAVKPLENIPQAPPEFKPANERPTQDEVPAMNLHLNNMPGPAHFEQPFAPFQRRTAVRVSLQRPTRLPATDSGAPFGRQHSPQPQRRISSRRYHESHFADFRPVPGARTTVRGVAQATPVITVPVSHDLTDQTCYQLRSRPRTAVIVSIALPFLLGLWLLLGITSPGRAISWLMGEASGNPATVQQQVPAVQQEPENIGLDTNNADAEKPALPRRRAVRPKIHR